ncbi:hypothetical protein [Arthrobacter sp. UYEF3]|uniref:hypothetical protein n=1 Tax=Arthrobacter sp. UYEF3 TaxID=1756365 RepID=UPI0033929931
MTVIIACLLSLGFVVSPASAAETSPANQATSDVAVQVPMQLDCVNMTDKAREYADAHQLCPKAGKAGGVSPNIAVQDNCGWSWVYVQSTGVRGYASINYGFDSSLGPVAWRSLAVGYAGNEYYGGWNDEDWTWNHYYQTGQVRYVGLGGASATMGGSVTLAWGGVCSVGPVNGSGYV